MELKQFLKIFKDNLTFIVILAFVGAIISLISANFLPSGYSASRVYFVVGQNGGATLNGYNFDNYFRGENARNFTDTAVAALSSPDFANTVLPGTDSLTVRKLAPQVIKITLSAHTSEDLNSNIEKIATRFNTQITELEGSSASQLRPIADATKPSFFALNKPILFVFGLILGVSVAIFILGAKNYFRL